MDHIPFQRFINRHADIDGSSSSFFRIAQPNSLAPQRGLLFNHLYVVIVKRGLSLVLIVCML
jgi:hypothetical protein